MLIGCWVLLQSDAVPDSRLQVLITTCNYPTVMLPECKIPPPLPSSFLPPISPSLCSG